MWQELHLFLQQTPHQSSSCVSTLGYAWSAISMSFENSSLAMGVSFRSRSIVWMHWRVLNRHRSQASSALQSRISSAATTCPILAIKRLYWSVKCFDCSLSVSELLLRLEQTPIVVWSWSAIAQSRCISDWALFSSASNLFISSWQTRCISLHWSRFAACWLFRLASSNRGFLWLHTYPCPMSIIGIVTRLTTGINPVHQSYP